MATLQATKWNQNQSQLKRILKDDFGLAIEQRDDPNFIEDLVEALQSIYRGQCTRAGKPLRSQHLTNMGKQAVEIMALPKGISRDIRTHLRRLAAKLNEENNFDIKAAPVISIAEMMALARALWEATTPTQAGSKFKRRAASTVIALATYSGLRWVDVTRLQWEDMAFQKNRGETPVFLRMRLRHNKTTMDNERRLTATICESRNVSLCPINRLRKWWRFTGRQVSGYVFPADTTGHLEGDPLIYQAQRMARLLHWTVKPGKHTCRVSLLVHLFDKGISLLSSADTSTGRQTQPCPFATYRTDWSSRKAPLHKSWQKNQMGRTPFTCLRLFRCRTTSDLYVLNIATFKNYFSLQTNNAWSRLFENLQWLRTAGWLRHGRATPRGRHRGRLHAQWGTCPFQKSSGRAAPFSLGRL